MTIECYYSACPFHSINHEIDQGPFCFEEECRVNHAYLKTIEKQRPDRDHNCEHVLTKWPENTRKIDTVTPTLWQCRVAVPVDHITGSTAAIVHTIYVNAPTLPEAWEVLTHIYGKNRKIKSISIKPGNHQVISP